MKTLLSLVFVSLLAASAFADIQDPPGNDYGPTRKLARGFCNFAYAPVEWLYQPSLINYYEGNNAAFSYGVLRGMGRSVVRMGTGAWEMLTFEFATNRGTYKPPLRSNIPWIHGGYEEFPPEMGFGAHYRYVRENYTAW